jgi:nitrate reductase gamma subunit
VMALLLVQVATGVYTAVTARWGYAWFTFVATPWLGSLVRLTPRVDLMSNLPVAFKVHALNAFVLIALVPYTRLAHIFVAPVEYLWRLPQVVIWRRPRPASPGGSP